MPAPAKAVREKSRKAPSPSPKRRTTEFDDTEEQFVETPTSFNLDFRRARNADAIEDTFDSDPDSTEALAAGDRDVDIESAATVGDETPGGDNPTPDMDVVDLIGRSLGVEYKDDEELKGADKILRRDRQRWELDPQSSEDFKDRNKP